MSVQPPPAEHIAAAEQVAAEHIASVGPDSAEPAPGPVTAQVGALLEGLAGRPVAEHAEVFGSVHSVLQNALSDAGRDPAAR